MIGDNNLCVEFNGLIGFITYFMELITLQPRIFSHMRNSLCIDGLCNSPCAFSQMNNLVGLHKILICENHRWSSYSQVLSQSLFFTTPIILGLFMRPDVDWASKPFSFFTDEKLWLTEERVAHEKQH